LFPAPLFGLLAAEFPDDAAGAELAVEAGVGAGPTIIQALLAITDLHLLAGDAGVPLRVMAAFTHEFHSVIISKRVRVKQGVRGILHGVPYSDKMAATG
jgi:hypothetical protein